MHASILYTRVHSGVPCGPHAPSLVHSRSEPQNANPQASRNNTGNAGTAGLLSSSLGVTSSNCPAASMVPKNGRLEQLMTTKNFSPLERSLDRRCECNPHGWERRAPHCSASWERVEQITPEKRVRAH